MSFNCRKPLRCSYNDLSSFCLAARIKSNVNGNYRRPTEQEIFPLQEALENPGKQIHAVCDLTTEGIFVLHLATG